MFILCILTRISIVIISKYIDNKYLPVLGYIHLCIGIGFLFIWITGIRQTGLEVGGDRIWWDSLRPVHAITNLMFAYNAINKSPISWYFLLIDIFIGLFGFLVYHSSHGSFKIIF